MILYSFIHDLYVSQFFIFLIQTLPKSEVTWYGRLTASRVTDVILESHQDELGD